MDDVALLVCILYISYCWSQVFNAIIPSPQRAELRAYLGHHRINKCAAMTLEILLSIKLCVSFHMHVIVLTRVSDTACAWLRYRYSGRTIDG